MFTLIEKLQDKWEYRINSKINSMAIKWGHNPILDKLIYWLYYHKGSVWLIHMLLTVGAIVLCWMGSTAIAAVLTVLSLAYCWRTRDFDMRQVPNWAGVLWFYPMIGLDKGWIQDIAAIAGIGLAHYVAGKEWVASILIAVNGAILLPRVTSMLLCILGFVITLPTAVWETFFKRDTMREKAFSISELGYNFPDPEGIQPWDEDCPEADEEGDSFHKCARKAMQEATKGKQIRKDREILAFESKKRDTETLFREVFLKVEHVAALCAAKKILGVFPDPHLLRVRYCRRNQRTGKDEMITGRGATAELNYFNVWSEQMGHLKAPGEVGEILKEAGAQVDAIKKRTPLISGVTVFFLLAGVLGCLAGAPMANFLLGDVLPTVVADWMKEYFLVRLLVMALIALAGVFLMALGSQMSEEKGFSLFKVVANGLFRLLIGIGSILAAVSTLMTGEPEAIAVLFVGAYFILVGLTCVIEDIKDLLKARKDKRSKKAAFIEYMEKYMRFVRLYLEVHRKWAACCDRETYKTAEKGIRKLEKSCDYLAKYYRKYAPRKRY